MREQRLAVIVSSALFLTFLGLTAGCSNSHTETYTKDRELIRESNQNRVPGEYIVTVREGADVSAAQALFSEFDIREVRDLGGRRLLLKLGKDPGPETVQRKAAGSEKIQAVQPNFIYRGTESGQRL